MMLGSSLAKVMIKNVKCVILDKDNYYFWEVRFSINLRGFQLIKYVDGSVDLTFFVRLIAGSTDL